MNSDIALSSDWQEKQLTSIQTKLHSNETEKNRVRPHVDSKKVVLHLVGIREILARVYSIVKKVPKTPMPQIQPSRF